MRRKPTANRLIAGQTFDTAIQEQVRAWLKQRKRRFNLKLVPNFIAIAGIFLTTEAHAAATLTLYFLTAVFAFISLRGRRLVLWLRKFDRIDLGRYPFATALSRACLTYASPLTLQDRHYRASDIYLLWAHPLHFLLFIPIALLPLLILGLAFYCLSRAIDEPTDLYYLSQLVSFPIAAIVGIWLAVRYVRYAGYHAVRGKRGLREIKRFVRRNRVIGNAIYGVAVFQCGSDIWKEAVLQFVKSSEVIVMDVSEITENIRWELETVFSNKPASQIILALGSSQQTGVFPQSVVDQLSAIVGRESVLECLKFVYVIPSLIPKRSYEGAPPSDTDDFEFLVHLAATRAERLRADRRQAD